MPATYHLRPAQQADASTILRLCTRLHAEAAIGALADACLTLSDVDA